MAAIGATVALASTGCTAMGSQPEEETVRVGVDLELSGSLSQLGTVYRNALELRVEQVNQQGLLRNGRRLELDMRDNRSDPSVSANNLREFANDPSVTAIVSGACTQCLLSAADTLNSEGIPTVSLAAADAVAQTAQDAAVRPLFKIGPESDQVAAAIISELTTQEANTVALVTSDDLYGREGQSALDAAAKDAGLAVAISESLALGGAISSTAQVIADYRSEPGSGDQFLTDDDALGPDAVVAWGLSPFGAEVAEALRAAGYEGQIYLDPGAADTLFLPDELDALSGAIMVFPETLVIDEVLATSPAKANRKNWFNDYTSRYGTYHAYSSFAADAIDIIVDSVNRTDSTERATIRAALEALEIDGLSGAIRMRPNDHSGLAAQALVAVVARDSRWRLAG